MFLYSLLLAAASFNFSCANEDDNSKFDNLLPYGKQEVSYTYPKADGNFRLLTFNVRRCMGNDNQINYNRTASVIKALNPDVVCVQELDSVRPRTGSVYQLAELAKLTGMNYYFGRGIRYEGGGSYGTGLLYKGKPISTRTIPLPGKEKRCVSVAEFDRYVLMCTHLALQAENREASVRIFTEEAKKYKKPVYLAGDFNEDKMESKFFVDLQKEWDIVSSSEFTFPVPKPVKRIDFIITLKKYPVTANASKAVYKMDGLNVDAVSDHYPVYCDFPTPPPFVVEDDPQEGKGEIPLAASDVRIANYYTQYCRGTDGKVDCNRFATAINKINADVLCIQQLDSCSERANNKYQIEELARMTKMHGYYMTTNKLTQGSMGQAILTKDKPLSIARVQLPGKKENRGAIIVEFEKYVVASTHFDTDMGNRIIALNILKDKLGAYHKPAFISGYFNEGNLKSDFFKEVEQNWTIVNKRIPTENRGKKRELDFIVYLNGLKPSLTKTDVIQQLSAVDLLTISKHYPVYCDFSGLK